MQMPGPCLNRRENSWKLKRNALSYLPNRLLDEDRLQVQSPRMKLNTRRRSKVRGAKGRSSMGRRSVGLMLALSFLSSSVLSSSTLVSCPLHDSSPESTSLHGNHAGSHDVGPGNVSNPEPSSPVDHACSCLGLCCPGPSPAAPMFHAPALTTALLAGPLFSVGGESGIPEPSAWLLPFANGPPLTL
jgi:hypothetical protein